MEFEQREDLVVEPTVVAESDGDVEAARHRSEEGVEQRIVALQSRGELNEEQPEAVAERVEGGGDVR